MPATVLCCWVNIARQIRERIFEMLVALRQRREPDAERRVLERRTTRRRCPSSARPPRDHVERGDGLGEQRRVAVRHAGDEGAEAGGLVRAAIAPSSVYASNISSSGGPMSGSWKKWSITKTVSKPLCSPATAIAATRSKSWLGSTSG